MKTMPYLFFTALVVLSVSLLIGCASIQKAPATSEQDKPMIDIEKEKEALLEVDRQFAKLSVEKGTVEAFKTYLAEDATILRNGNHPYVGKENILLLLAKGPDGILNWEPYFVEIGAAAGLGYTLGRYTFTLHPETEKEVIGYGYYVSIWKKMNGEWKLVFDTGNQSPPHSE